MEEQTSTPRERFGYSRASRDHNADLFRERGSSGAEASERARRIAEAARLKVLRRRTLR